MKFSELMQLFREKVDFVDAEVYRNAYTGAKGFHTDSIRWTDDYSGDDPVLDYALMGEEAYNRTVMANTSECADFADWYGDADAKILVVKIGGKDETLNRRGH